MEFQKRSDGVSKAGFVYPLMSFSNPWFLAALTGIVGWFHLKLAADFLNLSRLGQTLPESLKGLMSDEERALAAEYHVATTKLDVWEDAVRLGLMIAFWCFGGFGWLDGIVMSIGLGSIGSGLVLISVVALLGMMVSLPFEAWSTFKIEAAFGFNKTTAGTFIADLVKSLLLVALLGLPLLALVLWLFETTRWAAALAWLTVALFGLLMTWIAPRFLMPLFLKFTPMPDSDLRRAIMALAEKLAFPVAGIFTVDGSRRSKKANAFFAGFGKTRRIALFDTLLEGHTQEEIVAVLAHEIGHAKLGHVPKLIGADLLQSALMFGLLHYAVHDERLFAAFGLMYPSTAMGLVLFSIVYGAWSKVLDPLFSALSRKHEFEADAFARESVGSPQPLMTALKKLSKDHLAHLTPHPLYVWLHYSHPPVGERLEMLSQSRTQ